jgi:hypothetical protein
MRLGVTREERHALDGRMRVIVPVRVSVPVGVLGRVLRVVIVSVELMPLVEVLRMA